MKRDGSLLEYLRDAEDGERGRLQAETLRVWGIHRPSRNDLLLLFDPPCPDDARGLDRIKSWETPEELLDLIKREANYPGGFLYVVHAFEPTARPTWHYAQHFGAQEAANVFAKARAVETARVEKLTGRLRETMQDFAFDKQGGRHG